MKIAECSRKRVEMSVFAALLLIWALPLLGQQTTRIGVPPLMKFTGVLSDGNGKPLTGVVGVTFYLYKDQESAAPLWMETQNVQADTQGRYSVQLGATKPDGLPTDAFASGEARWLGVQVSGQEEQPRVLLLSVPYALKAADAETVGGLPPSAFARVNPEGGAASTDNGSSSSTALKPSLKDDASAPASKTVTTPGGTVNFLPIWTGSATIGNSTVFQTGGKVGIGTTGPAATLDVNGNISGRDNLGLPQTTGSTLGVITLGGSAFIHACCSAASVNTFVGVSAGPLTGGGNSNTGIGNKALAGLTSGFSNTAVGTNALLVNNTGESNTAVGDNAMVATTEGNNNTAVGENALRTNNGGGANTATGFDALNDNSSGAENTAMGDEALLSNTTGNFNSAFGFDANVNAGNLTNATAIGANSLVSESNAIVLGCTFNCAAGTSQPFVGIGTTAPLAPLDVLALSSNIHTLVGNVGCGSSNAGIIFATTLNANCQTYAISGDTDGNTYVDAPGGELHLRIAPNADAMIIDTHANASILGNLTVTGNLSKSSGSFKIDHPLDPSNKYLYHSFVESPDMMNIYNGNVTTNRQGLAVIVLPSYFEALNRDFRYQLTVIGRFAQAIVAKEISHDRFTIKTNQPDVKVSWQVTGIRHDAYADAHRIPVEQEKTLNERGKYLHPELFGATQDQAIGYSARPTASSADPTSEAASSSTAPVGAN